MGAFLSFCLHFFKRELGKEVYSTVLMHSLGLERNSALFIFCLGLLLCSVWSYSHALQAGVLGCHFERKKGRKISSAWSTYHSTRLGVGKGGQSISDSWTSGEVL